LRQKQKE